MELVFVRHTSVAVPKGTCYGATDVALSNTFDDEARQVKEKLAGERFDKVFCSPLTRCRKLAEYCFDTHITIDRRLLELNFGEWEMQRFDDITDPRLQQWYADYINVRATGGESFMDQYRRVREFIDYVTAQPYERVAIITHGGVLMQAMLIFGLATADTLISRQPQYGEVLKIDTRGVTE